MVCFKGQKFYTSSLINQRYIFTKASLEKEISAYSEMALPHEIDNMIKKKLKELTALSVSGIEQKKSKNGAPNYYHNETPLTRSCSISHHGNYGVFSFVQA